MDDAHKLAQRMRDFFNKQDIKEQFSSLGSHAISKYSDKNLASWQSEYPPESPQFILGEHEWQRRLMEKQIKATKFAAYMGIGGTVLGVILGALISLFITSRSDPKLPKSQPTMGITLDSTNNHSSSGSDKTNTNTEKRSKPVIR